MERKKATKQTEISELREENNRLQVLLHFAQNLQEHLQLENLLLTTMIEVAKILRAERCTVFLLDEAAGELWSMVALGLRKGKEIRFPIEHGIAGHVAKTGEILNIPDAYSDPRFNPKIDRETGYRTRNMLTMPLKNKDGDILGVFQVLNKKNGVFTKQDEELLGAISRIAATAIENSLLYNEQVESLNSFVETLSATLDTRDYITAGHSRRVMLYATEICHQLKLESEYCEQIRYAALLHDIGKLGVPESVLFKAGGLSDEEFELIKKHPAVTRQILESIHFPRNLNLVPEIASTHHEKINGKGYPAGLTKKDIPFGGRILALADVFDALTSRRQYKDRMPIDAVWNIISSEQKDSFDPAVVDAFGRISLANMLFILNAGYEYPDVLSYPSHFKSLAFSRFVEIKIKNPEILTRKEKSILKDFEHFYWLTDHLSSQE